MNALPINSATMGMVNFTRNIIEYLETIPSAFGEFAEWVIRDANGPERALAMSDEDHMNAVMQIEQAMTVTRKTTEAIHILFPPESWQSPFSFMSAMPIHIHHEQDEDTPDS